MNPTAGNPQSGPHKTGSLNTVNPYTGLSSAARRGLALLLTAALAAAASGALALPDDRDQPIHIESDRAQRDGREGVTIYQGDVRLRQGSMRIRADRLEIRTDANNEVLEVIAEGRPAQFEQQPDPDDPPVDAEARRIHYRVSEDQLELMTNARLNQGEATMSGNRIDYNIATELVTAEGDASSDRPRIEMVIPPRRERSQQD